MGTLVCFHAHPDDECINTGGTMARAAADGHRVVLVVATGGEWGESPADLAVGETLAQRRAIEVNRSAAILGVQRVEFLGYEDSGMTGWDQNANTGAFMNAPLDEAANRLAEILRNENASTLTIYDWHGGYGHPDHIAVHRVGARAAELAETPYVYEATMNRTAMLRFFEELKASGIDPEFDPESGTDDGTPIGTPEEELTTSIDVSSHLEKKRASMAAHGSQITDASFFMQMPPEAFMAAFGTEWFRRSKPTMEGAPAAMETWLGGLS
jgi:LmbE family N-acetylglucosaminyl deacetylase